MVASFVGFSRGWDSDADADADVTVPLGTVDGDLMVSMHPFIRNASLTPPGGWTLWPSVDLFQGGAGCDMGFSYRIASGETAGTTSYSFQADVLDSVVIATFRGFNAPTVGDVVDYDDTPTTGDWHQGLASVSPVTRTPASLSDLSIAQPIILVGFATTTGTTGGTDKFTTGVGSWDQGTLCHSAKGAKNGNLSDLWTIYLVDKGVARPATNYTVSWSDGNFPANGHFVGARLFGATETEDDTTGDAWAWIG